MLETDPIKNGTTKKASYSANETLNRNAASFVVMTGFNAAFFFISPANDRKALWHIMPKEEGKEGVR